MRRHQTGPPPNRRRFGLGPKVLALAVLPSLLMAGLAAYTIWSGNRLLTGTLSELARHQAELRRIDDAVAEAKDSMLALQQRIAAMNDVHQRGLLRADPSLAAPTRARRGEVMVAVDRFAAGMGGLASALRAAGLLDVAGMDPGRQAMMARRVAFLERAPTTLRRLMMLVNKANDRTIDVLEAGEGTRAVNNFIYEEQARVQAVRLRLDRVASVLVALGRDVAAAQDVRTAAQQADARARAAWTGRAMALILILGVIGVSVGAAAFAWFRLTRPFQRMVASMRQLARGDLAAAVPRNQPDELADMAQALIVFKANAAEADRANRAKSEFLATMSHELRTPLNAILGYAEILKNEMMGPLGNAKYRGYAEDVYRSGRHLLDLINDVLDLAKVEAGHYKLAEDRVPVAGLLEAALALVRPQATRNSLDLRSELSKPEVALLGDERALKQILLNLVWNAVKYTPEGGQVVVRVGNGDGLRVTVQDDGPGIPEAEQRRIFEPFVQGGDARRLGVEGTGLGLALCRRLAEMHDAELALESVEGRGTTVSVRFPAWRVVTG